MSDVIAFNIAGDNPCMHCGACCAYFRVSFYWAELRAGGGNVPDDMAEKLNDFMACMKGTNDKHPRCMNLKGEIGECVACSAYDNRPSPCREFQQSWEDGFQNEACDKARAAYGLPPLMPPHHFSDNAA